MSLTEEQKRYLEEKFTNFAKILSTKQRSQLYFGLDDLIQYGQGSIYIAHAAVAKIRKEEKQAKK